MKKLPIFCLLLISLLGSLTANTSFLALKSQVLVQNTSARNLTEAIRALDSDGAEIYYYNEYYIVAKLQTDPGSILRRGDGRILATDPNQKLYLITKLGSDQDSALSSFDVILDLETSLLIQSRFDEVSLRALLPH
ncbi:MAG TPA: hypothetical protein P5533_04420, partial [Candidatus Cloacimonadota bacterium]|nr:hypothetical protein [Candidatus Cloacimonadota bacterium]